MSRFRKLSHAIWHCQYHIVWTPNYRFRILSGAVAEEVARCTRTISEQLTCEVVKLNVQIDHGHLLVMNPLKIAVSDYVGTVKGRTPIRVFNRFQHPGRKPYWGNHFWVKGYCADTVGLDAEKIRAYVKYQEKREQLAEQAELLTKS